MRSFFFLLVCFVMCAAPFVARADNKGQAVQALADKSDRVVVFFDANNREIARFSAVFGQIKGPKIRRGDGKTPEGDYTMHPPRPSENWGWFMPIDYPNRDDMARGKKMGIHRDDLGGQIGLHASGDGFLHNVRQNFGENWTQGCIAVTNGEMEHIRRIVTSPILLRIQP